MGSQYSLKEWQARELLLKLNKVYSVRKLTYFLGTSKSSVYRWFHVEKILREYVVKI